MPRGHWLGGLVSFLKLLRIKFQNRSRVGGRVVGVCVGVCKHPGLLAMHHGFFKLSAPPFIEISLGVRKKLQSLELG